MRDDFTSEFQRARHDRADIGRALENTLELVPNICQKYDFAM